MASEKHSILSLPFSTRANQPNNSPLATYLLSLISIKRSNLCVSADLHTTYDLLSVAEEVGDYICVLKTHADIIDDWSEKTIEGLEKISRRKRFLLFEDRKLGDIGSRQIPLSTTFSLPLQCCQCLLNGWRSLVIQTRFNLNTPAGPLLSAPGLTLPTLISYPVPP